jgi:transposase
MDEAIIQRILHLAEVEKLSQRQIARTLGINRKCVRKILGGINSGAKPMIKKTKIDDYLGLIAQWYKQYPKLLALQIYERLKSYGYTGGYGCVKRATLEYRRPKQMAYHPLTFMPGQEAQVDWFFFNHPVIGKVAGFLYVLCYSRYAWGIFYPRHCFEFFLAGHLECYRHLSGLPRSQRYDNCSSVVTARDPQIKYNAQFLDFARFYGFSIELCNPNSGNEKGRVERKIRDIRIFLDTETFKDLNDLNRKFHLWLEKSNNTVHRVTGKTPKEMLPQEKLIQLPVNTYLARRIVTARVSKTALVEFETNKYTVPTSCVGKMVDVAAYVGHVEIWIDKDKVATHKRCFGQKQLIQNPLHSDQLLDRSPQFKLKRIKQMMIQMDTALAEFIGQQDDETAALSAAYQIYQLTKMVSRAMVLSAVRELNGMKCFKIKALISLLNLPSRQEPPAVWPKNQDLLNLNYEERNLTDYDPDTGNL